MGWYQVRPITGWSGLRTAAAARRGRRTFSASWTTTLDLLRREVDRLGGHQVVLQADVSEGDIRIDGTLRANAHPADPGVRLLFDSNYGALVYQCDSCSFWQHNVRSIALGLEALRAVDRYGINAVAGQQYKGYREIGTGSGDDRPETVLERHAGVTLAEAGSVERLYRRAARRTHPDANEGRRDAWDDVQQAWSVLYPKPRGGRA